MSKILEKLLDNKLFVTLLYTLFTLICLSPFIIGLYFEDRELFYRSVPYIIGVTYLICLLKPMA